MDIANPHQDAKPVEATRDEKKKLAWQVGIATGMAVAAIAMPLCAGVGLLGAGMAMAVTHLSLVGVAAGGASVTGAWVCGSALAALASPAAAWSVVHASNSARSSTEEDVEYRLKGQLPPDIKGKLAYMRERVAEGVRQLGKNWTEPTPTNIRM